MQQPPNYPDAARAYGAQLPAQTVPTHAQGQPQRDRIAHVGQQFRAVVQNVERVILGKTDVIARVRREEGS